MLIFLTIFIPFISAFLVLLIGEKSQRLRNGIITLTCIVDFILVLMIGQAVTSALPGHLPTFTLVDTPFFKFQFQIDTFSLFMGLLVSFLWIFTELYSFGYMQDEHKQTRYFTCLTLCLGITLGIVFAGNLLTLFIFYELLTYAVYPLVIHEESEEAFRAGIIYLIYLLTGGIMLLLAIFLTYKLANGNLNFTAGGIPELFNQNKIALYLLFVLYIAGFGVKSTIMPLHSWLPRAMIAPTPISALLHAVAVVKVGLYGIIRTIYSVFGADLFRQLKLNYVLGILASITIILSAIMALKQSRIKRLLAYSTINQLSFVILGAASCHPIGLFGALIHLMYHSFMKITLFYSAGSFIKRTGKTLIKEMAGIAKYLPVTSAAFAIGTWGIVGLPPIAGWVSKFYLIKGYFSLGQMYFVLVYAVSSFIELGFFLPPIVYAYFKAYPAEVPMNIGTKAGRSEGAITPSEPDLNMLIPIIMTAVLSFIFGISGGIPHLLARNIVQDFLVR